MEKKIKHKYSEVIKSKHKLLDLNINEIFSYRDLILLFVKRDFITFYKQTILGPLWIIIQPLLTTITFTFIFGYIANISTQGTPHVLFYFSGILCWGFFSECVKKTSNTFINNSQIFGKVYFPRMAIPVSIVLFNALNFFIQFIFFILILLFYIHFKELDFQFNVYLLLVPLIILLIGMLGISLGIIVSSFTTKYRDLRFLVDFGLQLLMYATPIIYPISSVPDWFRNSVYLNPMSSIIELFRHAFFQTEELNPNNLIYTIIVTVVLLIIGLITFNKVQRNFIDTI